MRSIRDYLSSLSKEELQAITGSYLKWQIAEDYLAVEGQKADFLDPMIFIPNLLRSSGCVYKEEKQSYLKYLSKELQHYRAGENVFFDPNGWSSLMQIESLFQIKL